MPVGTSAMVGLGSATTTGTTSSITFTAIGSYRDYIIQGVTTQGGTAYWAIRFNGDTTTSNPLVYAIAYDPAGTIISGTSSITGNTYAGNIGGNQTVVTAHIFDASATDKHKTVLGRWSNMGRPEVGMSAARWASNSAVTSIVVLVPGGSFAADTTLSLYGVSA